MEKLRAELLGPLVPFPLLRDPSTYDPNTFNYEEMEKKGLPGRLEWIEVFRKVRVLAHNMDESDSPSSCS